MARHTVGGVATTVGTATLPLVSIYNTATIRFQLREVHIFNTTATGSFTVALCRLSSTGTPGVGLTEVSLSGAAAVAGSTAFAGHTLAPTLADLGYRKRMGPAVGDGVIWTFNGAAGVSSVLGAANGIGLYVPVGTGQIMDYCLVWDED